MKKIGACLLLIGSFLVLSLFTGCQARTVMVDTVLTVDSSWSGSRVMTVSFAAKDYPDEQAQAALEGQPIPPLPPLAQRCDTAVRQIELAARDKGEHIAILEARKQYAWYLKGVPHAGYYKEQIVRMNTLEDMYRITEGIRRDLI